MDKLFVRDKTLNTIHYFLESSTYTPAVNEELSNDLVSLKQFGLLKAVLEERGADAKTVLDAMEAEIADNEYHTQTAANKLVALEFHVKGIITLTCTDIVWQLGTTVRATFSGTPDLSEIFANDVFEISTASNSTNNGRFTITTINDASDYIEFTNAARTDATDNETSVSLACKVDYSEWNDTTLTQSQHNENFDKKNTLIETSIIRREKTFSRLLEKATKKNKLTPSQRGRAKGRGAKHINDWKGQRIKGKTYGDDILGINNFVASDDLYGAQAITAANTGGDWVEFDGGSNAAEHVAIALDALTARIEASTFNDGDYTISAAVIQSGTTVRVTFNEALPNNTADGNVYIGGLRSEPFYDAALETDAKSIIIDGINSETFL